MADAVNATGGVAVVASPGGTPSNGDTLDIGGRIYTFKTALTPANDEVLINGRVNSYVNLGHAINKSGGVANIDYKVATANEDVVAGTVAADALPLTARVAGTDGNGITTVAVSSEFGVLGAHLTGGVDASPIPSWDHIEELNAERAAALARIIEIDQEIAFETQALIRALTAPLVVA